MRVEKRLAVVLLLLALTPLPLLAAEKGAPPSKTVPEADTKKDYNIGAGDQLNIEVWMEPSMTRLVTVLPDGKISYPLIGYIMAAGKTVPQLRKEIQDKVSFYTKDPEINVEVRQANSLQIYVLGRVKTPGRAVCTSNIDVLQALATAGGPDQFAKLSRIRIFRREGDKTVIIPFDYEDVTSGKSPEMNILLLRGDVVYVP